MKLEWDDEQERRGAVLSATGVQPELTRTLAERLEDVDSALDILSRFGVARIFLDEDGKFGNVQAASLSEYVDKLVARFRAFEDSTTTEEEIQERRGVENVDWRWVETGFGMKRMRIKKK